LRKNYSTDSLQILHTSYLYIYLLFVRNCFWKLYTKSTFFYCKIQRKFREKFNFIFKHAPFFFNFQFFLSDK